MSATADRELAFAGPGELARLVREREVRPRELVELYVRRIEELDPRLNAFRRVRAEQALAEADALELDGGPELALAGVPIAVKDDQPVAGEITTRGTRSFGHAASADSESIRRLRAAGAIPLGITNVPELTIFPWTATTANGVTRNPWNPGRTPGGSSGGSAAAVAAGMAAAATASDGGGSIRIPAAACGLVGLKPSRGRVSHQPGAEGWLGLVVNGALTRTVADSALLLDVLNGALAADNSTLPPFTGSYRAAAQEGRDAGPRLRIAVSRRVPPGVIVRLSAAQRDAWERTAALLSLLGHEVVERDPAYGAAQIEFVQMWLRGIYEESLKIADRSTFEPSTRQMAAAGRRLVPGRRRSALLAARDRRTARLTALWDEFDVLLTPGLARTAIAAEGGYGKPAPLAIDIAARFTPFTAVFNLTGQPAVSLPAGLGPDGLPLSIQLVGRLGAEDMLYRLAAQIEAAAPWAQLRPPVS